MYSLRSPRASCSHFQAFKSVAQASRNEVYQITLIQRTVRYASASATDPSNPSLIKVSNVPAPHFGVIRILSLNRPAAKNAISKQLLSELKYQVDAVHEEQGAGDTRAVVIASEVDSIFCAGADLKERRGFTPEETAAFLTTLRSTFHNISLLPVPTISAVSSIALGGGLELALTTHLRVFSSLSTVGLPETRLGIIPGAGGTFRLPAIIGLSRARDMILTGRRVTGAEAYFLGLCDRLVQVLPEEKLEEGRKKVLDEAVRLAREICEGGPVATAAVLKALEGFPSQETESRAYDLVMGTEDRMEALRAFGEKRKPVFKGR